MPGPPLREQQRPRRVLAELRREERRRAELAHDERLRLVGIGQQQREIRRLIDIRKSHDRPVVVPQRLDVDAGFLAGSSAATAIAHGAWIRPPRGARRTARQSPSSSRPRSMTIVARVGDGARLPPSDRAGAAAGSSAARASRS